MNYAEILMYAYKQNLWLEKLIPVGSFEFQREHQGFRHQR